MEYFFILGRNPILSKAEIFAYLEGHGVEFEELAFRKNFLIISVDKEIKINVQEFGGLIKFGKIMFSGTEIGFEDFIYHNELVEKDKFTYSVQGNLDDEIFVDKFKTERRRAVIRRGGKQLKFQAEDPESVAKAQYDFFALLSDKDEKDKRVYFGIAEKKYDYTDIKKRDMQKPNRRQEYAISPRLAKILINLSQVKPNQLLLDPFCGVGGILLEALVKGINVYGIDNDQKAITLARQNLKWLESNYKINASWKLMAEDSRNPPNIKPDAIVAETPLGILFRKKPSDRESEKIIESFEKLIISVLKKLAKIKKPGAKIVLTMPLVREASVNMRNITQQTGLKEYKLKNIVFPIQEFRPNQYISREIVVLV